ncbi:MAG: glycine dehydrogenase subunit 1 [Clostridiales bacterium]|jgi:glycine dehydrogenase subunit 1|nr:glycine dehydrogenase subunit 1 [Clostridiales bacterium]
MFPYIPNTDEDVARMLEALGLDSVEALFSDVPEAVKLNRRLDLCAPLSETEVTKQIKALADQNVSTDSLVCFLGAGAYDHAVPSVIKHLIGRSEFNTAYTPYQPEISQGTLQAIFEYQTMIANLTGMDVANASMYDGASATAEAAVLAAANQKGDTVLIASTVHPETIAVVETYMRFKGIKVVQIEAKDGVMDRDALTAKLNADVVGVVVQQPNFYGIVEDYTGVAEAVHEAKALFIMNVDPIGAALLKTPGEYDADLAVGEGQPLGNGLNYGGPYLGFMASTKKQMRKLPGRIVGQTVDLDGKRAFTLTLQAREQHIRREKATSNICSNQALNALTATIFMSVTGREGLYQMAAETARRAYYGYEKLLATGHFKPAYAQPFFREFALEVNGGADVDSINAHLFENGILGGLNISDDNAQRILFCITEKRTVEEIDRLVEVLEAYPW